MDISRKILEKLDLDSVLMSIVEKAPLFLKSDGSVLRLLNDKENLLEVARAYNVGQAFMGALKPGEGAASFVLKEGRVVVVPDISKDPYFLMKEDARKEGFVSAIFVPLRAEEKVIGTLSVHSRKRRRYGEKDIFLLQAFADQAALAIENARFHQKLKETTEIYQVLTETAAIVKLGTFLVQGEEGQKDVVHFVNEELCRMSGYSRDELLSMCHWNLTDPEEFVQAEKKWEKGKAEGKTSFFSRGFLLNKKGEKVPIELSFGITTYRGKEATVGFVRDLTAEKEREARFEEFYENASDALFTMDKDGRMIRANKKVEETTGYTREEFGQARFSKVVAEEDLERLMSYSRARREGRPAPAEYEFKLKAKDGTIKDICMTIHQRPGKEGVVDASMRDVTERKRMEAELSSKFQELDQRKKELSTLLESSRRITSPLDLDTVLTSIVGLAPKILEVDSSSLRLWDEEKGLLEVVKSHKRAADSKRPVKAGEGITGLCFQEGRPIVVDEVLKDPRYVYKDFAEKENITSMACVPILVKDKTIGTLSVYCREVKKFEEREVSLLSGFADQAAIAIHNARLFGESQKKVGELSGLFAISQAFSAMTDVREIYGIIVRQIAELLGAEKGLILLYDEKTNSLQGQYPAWGWSDEQMEVFNYPLTENLASYQVKVTGQPYISNDAANDPHILRSPLDEIQPKNSLLAGLQWKEKFLGVVLAQNKRTGGFTEDDAKLFSIFAGQAALAIENARVYEELKKSEEELREISITDGLTGLYNQRQFYRDLEKEMERSKRQGSPFCLLLFDLDGFKAFNDTHGHLEGDYTLKKVAQTSRTAIRKIDSAYRYGGDEFTVILPGAEEEEGVLVAERIRKSCEELLFSQGISLSIGLVEFNPQYDLPTFIKHADEAMYRAKSMGGNQVFVFSSVKSSP